MLTKVTIRNFKRFDKVEIELASPVVFVGPNNSGKTSAMQALALWDIGVRRWNEKRTNGSAAERRRGVTVNRRDLHAIPSSSAALLWHDLRVRNVERSGSSQRTRNVRIEIMVEGINHGRNWICGMEFDYANEESFYCRPLPLEEGRSPRRMPIPEEAGQQRVAFLPSLSGLASTEVRLDQGAVNVRVGEGRTAEVLRNLCLRILEEHPTRWKLLVERLESLFEVQMDDPVYIPERGEIVMKYRQGCSTLDLTSSGRGLQQTLFVLAYIQANPGAIILLDEPDAHLEILRKRQIYRLITEAASECGSQIIAASHSEVLLNEAAGKDLVVAFVGNPHRIGGQPGPVHRALAEIGYEHYLQAEQTGWVLYVESSTDLAILQTLARRLGNCRAVEVLERPFVHYVGNQQLAANNHFFGLREALPELAGVALFDRTERDQTESQFLRLLCWKKREIENYICSQSTLESYARTLNQEGELLPLFAAAEVEIRQQAMRDSISDLRNALTTLGKGSPWDADVKASEDVLAPLFQNYFTKLGLPNLMNKKNFYELAEHVPEAEIDPEIGEKLDAIVAVADSAQPACSANS